MQGGEIAVLDGEAMEPADRAELDRAMRRLRSGGGVVIRLADKAGSVVGRTLRFGSGRLSGMPKAKEAIQAVVETAMRRAFDIAVLRLHADGEAQRSEQLARPIVMLSGAVGGFLGMSGFVPDAAVTTLSIMREIARIAQEEGESLDDPETREACLQVFALSPADGSAGEPEGTYFSARLMLSGRPLTLLMTDVASRFGMTLSQKFAAQAVPVMGAVSGAVLNGAFLGHYRELARAHFTVRRLERRYGAGVVRGAAV